VRFTLKRSVVKAQPASATFHDNPTPASARISQALAAQNLLDLFGHSKRNGVCVDGIVEELVSQLAGQDPVGKVDLAQVIDSYARTLESVASELQETSNTYDEARYELENARDSHESSGAGVSLDGVAVPHTPPNCAALPPVVLEQVNRRINRESAR
jgi:hypothetical protein